MRKLSGGLKTESFFKITESHKKRLRVIGLNSGTSCDGLDAALVEFTPDGRLGRRWASRHVTEENEQTKKFIYKVSI